MIFFKPRQLGPTSLTAEELREDRKNSRNIGPCAIGRRAIYLNSFYIDRMYYVAVDDVRRIFKRVAMSRGGFTGKGIFGSMPYLVVQMKNGSEKQCNFKFEQQVDQFLGEFGAEHPSIPLHSADAERRLREAEEKEQAKYLKTLSAEAEAAVRRLRGAQTQLEKKPELYRNLQAAAKQKRIIDGIDPSYQFVAGVIFAAAAAAALFGVYAMTKGMGGAVYFVLFGLAAISVIAASRVLPTGKRNRTAAKRDWDSAEQAMADYLETLGKFPLPARYAHPVVLERMIRAIRQGRAESGEEAFRVVREDLRALNSDVTVSQKEYDEVVAVKPLFLVSDYQ
ncbi:MAG: ATPase P [Lachnospiraceae bacterium]|jgi:hypothetical protein|nr:ATPase P [Lachnospiraceae bacterium]